jgi:hypothetical protein
MNPGRKEKIETRRSAQEEAKKPKTIYEKKVQAPR